MSKNNYYAVLSGRKPGIYSSWDECKEQVVNFSNAKYKGFPTIEEAEKFLSGKTEKVQELNKEYDAIFYVDGSYFEKDEVYGYGVVAILKDGRIETFDGAGNNEESKKLRNVTGEMLGALHATKWAMSQGYKCIAIYYDYMGIECWATGEWKTKTKLTSLYADTMNVWIEKIKVDFIKVKGHSGVQYNEMADKLAKGAVKKLKLMQNKC